MDRTRPTGPVAGEGAPSPRRRLRRWTGGGRGGLSRRASFKVAVAAAIPASCLGNRRASPAAPTRAARAADPTRARILIAGRETRGTWQLQTI